MKADDRRGQLRDILSEIASHFAGVGWRIERSPSSMLCMRQEPACDVEHTLLVSEPFRPEKLPSIGLLGLTCDVNVYFPKLEKLINAALQLDPLEQGKVSLRLSLGRLTPIDRLYAGAVHLVSLDEEIHSAIAPLINDYNSFLEPLRIVCSTTAMFLQDEPPPELRGLRWELLRATYCRIHSATPVWLELFARLQKRAEAIMATEKPNDPGRAFVFTDLRVAQRGVELRAAETMLKFITAASRRDWFA